MGIDPFGLDTRVCYYPEAASGLGHIGSGKDTDTWQNGKPKTWGFYTTGGNQLDRLTNAISGTKRGQVKRDTQEVQECTTIETDDEQDECIRMCNLEKIVNPVNYWLFGYQCTSHVRDCLRICGIYDSVYDGPDPEKLFDEIKQQTNTGMNDE